MAYVKIDFASCHSTHHLHVFSPSNLLNCFVFLNFNQTRKTWKLILKEKTQQSRVCVCVCVLYFLETLLLSPHTKNNEVPLRQQKQQSRFFWCFGLAFFYFLSYYVGHIKLLKNLTEKHLSSLSVPTSLVQQTNKKNKTTRPWNQENEKHTHTHPLQ
jgi:hypothetical protein